MSVPQEAPERYARRQLLTAQFWVFFGFGIFPFIVGLIYILPSRQPVKPDGIAWPPSDDWFAPISVPVAGVSLLFAYGAWLLNPLVLRIPVLALAAALILFLPGTWNSLDEYLPANSSRFLLAIACWWALRTLVALGEPVTPTINRWRAMALPLAGCLLALIPLSENDSYFWLRVWVSWLIGMCIETDGLRLRWNSLAAPGKQAGE